jgi:phospholipid-binding lipoprotein MlaA
LKENTNIVTKSNPNNQNKRIALLNIALINNVLLNKGYQTVIFLGLLLLLTSCASTTHEGDVADPFEPMNRTVYQFNETVDTYVTKPIAETYQYTPSPVRTGVRNFFNNIDDVLTVINDVMQFKIQQGLTDSMRIVFNSSFGLFGLVDVASDWDLPRHNERFADTLGYWGINSGPYLVLPIFGPSSVRDASALIADIFSYPLANMHPVAHRNTLQGLKMVSNRTDLLTVTDLTEDVAINPYAFTRDTYYQWRQNQIFDGSPPEQFPQDFNPDELE